MKKIKILTITTSGLGKKEGISTIILDYYSYFDKNKFQLDLIASGEYNYKLVTEFQNIGVNIRCLPSRKISVIEYIKALIDLIKKEKYDAIYIHGSSSLMCLELVIARIYGCKIRIVHSHNTTCDHKKLDGILRPLFYKSYTRALACGTDAGKWLYGNRPFDIVKNGRNTDTYRFNEEKRREMRKKLEISDDTIAIGHVGNFNLQKNQIFLIDLIENTIKTNKDIKLYLIGDGKTKSTLINQVKNRGLEQNVFFMGSISNVPEVLQAMDLMLLPSLHEGLPLVAIEWQMMGLPSILSDKITSECSFTELVKFLPLKDSKKWEKMIDKKWLHYDRFNASKNAIAEAKKAGYDIQMNVIKLQNYFIKGENH